MSSAAGSFGVQLDSLSLLVIGSVCVIYFTLVLGFGIFFNKFSKTTNDFFYSGQRFPFWVIGASMVATGIGSYSFLKYSEQGYLSGMSSAMTYTNDWFVAPFFMFGWLPIIYYSKVKSIPEYFERRFNSTARYITLTIILMYMFFYIGYNLFTIGIAIEGLLGINMLYGLPVVVVVLGAYVSLGGQTAVIMTDLVQGLILYAVGFICIAAGLYYLGGLKEWWYWLPESHRLPFVHLTENKSFNTIGLFWGQAVAGAIAFAFMNQGFIMRFLAARSVHEGRKAVTMNVLFALPVSAIVVGCIGWIGKSIMEKMGPSFPGYEGILANSYNTFLIVAWEVLSHNSIVFGLVIAALTAALMSTVDTLINACAAVAIFDLYKPLIKPKASEAHYLKAAKWASIISTVIGFSLVFVFLNLKGTLMAIHYKGIMIIIPSLVTTIFMGAFWRGMTSAAAVSAMILGSAATISSIWFPSLLHPVAKFVGAAVELDGSYIYIRAVFGISVSLCIGFLVSLITRPKASRDIEGLTIWTIDKGMEKFKGAPASHSRGKPVEKLRWIVRKDLKPGEISLSKSTARTIKANTGDLIFVEDDRWWLGGLRSTQSKLVSIHNSEKDELFLSRESANEGMFIKNRTLRVDKLF
ncbi:MAG: sodium:solute symporter [Bdellovibrionales bacterium]